MISDCWMLTLESEQKLINSRFCLIVMRELGNLDIGRGKERMHTHRHMKRCILPETHDLYSHQRKTYATNEIYHNSHCCDCGCGSHTHIRCNGFAMHVFCTLLCKIFSFEWPDLDWCMRELFIQAHLILHSSNTWEWDVVAVDWGECHNA